MTSPPKFEVRVVPRIADLGEAAWDAMWRPEDTPFLRYAWLEALEATGCVKPEVGWVAQHLALFKDDVLVAAAPAYLKGNYEGEFVFDHAWERVAEQIGVDYYPKLIVAVPFTPATGSRLLAVRDEHEKTHREVLSEALRLVVAKIEVSSAHVLFPTQADHDVLVANRFLSRYGVQFHWKNKGFKTYDDFLGSFNSKRRHQLKRERREVEESGIVTHTYRGKEIGEEELDAMSRFYFSQAEKYYPWTRAYLTRPFFERVLERMPESIEIVLAKEHGKAIGGALNIAGNKRLYGRYWGSSEQRPFLHFHVCYYHSIDACIERGFDVFEPGAGGEHKVPRGFEPTITRSAHHIANAKLRKIIGDHLMRERAAIEEAVAKGEDP